MRLIGRMGHCWRQGAATAILVLIIFGFLNAQAEPTLAESASLSALLSQAQEKNLAEHPYWHRLLHYRRNLLGSYQSEIDGENFFLSKDGRRRSDAELKATLTAFFEPVPADSEKEHPQCRYPARAAWLREQLNFPENIPKPECSRFQAWRSKLDPEAVSLVFTSYYMNNPASMYGHTFLRLHRRGAYRNNPLLDYTVNFAAATDTQNGILFAALGLTGGFRGMFSTLPYYMKVQEYNNMESRDLWEYQLTLDASSIERLEQHLWELGHTSMAYFFLNKNCSYQLLPLLEVADPSLRLTDGFKTKAIPLDTLHRILRQPGLVTGYQLRPSHLRKMVTSRSLLAKDEQRLAQGFYERPWENLELHLERLPEPRRRMTLNAAYDYLKYQSGFKRQQPKEVKDAERRILLLQNAFSAASKDSPMSASDTPLENTPAPAEPPHVGHDTGRLGLSFGVTRDSSFEEISLRPAIHDMEALQTGYVAGSQLEMFHLKTRYDNKLGKAWLEDFTLLEVKSLTAWEPWVKPPSWRLKAGFSSAHDLEAPPHHRQYFGLSGGTGVAFRNPADSRGTAYGLIEFDSGVGGIFNKHYRIGIGGTAGLLFNPWRPMKLHFTGTYVRYPAGDISSVNKLRLVNAFSISRDLEIRVSLERQNHYREGMLSVNIYY